MTALEKTAEALQSRGFAVSCCDTAEQAARTIAGSLSGQTVGFGGSVTLEQLGLYDLLARAAGAQVYLTSANAIAETGEIVNIDGTGNRLAAMLYGHERLVIVAGVNKLAPDLERAVFRARNIAAPKNARRLHRETPCALTIRPAATTAGRPSGSAGGSAF